ncbi:MAG: cytochrome c [Nitrosomonas halophila]
MISSKYIPIIKIRPIIVGVVFSISLSVHAEDSAQPRDGEIVYAKICGYCHEVGIGPNIKDRQLPPEYIHYIVRRGLRAMPAFPEPYISDEELKQIGRFIY